MWTNKYFLSINEKKSKAASRLLYLSIWTSTSTLKICTGISYITKCLCHIFYIKSFCLKCLLFILIFLFIVFLSYLGFNIENVVTNMENHKVQKLFLLLRYIFENFFVYTFCVYCRLPILKVLFFLLRPSPVFQLSVCLSVVYTVVSLFVYFFVSMCVYLCDFCVFVSLSVCFSAAVL